MNVWMTTFCFICSVRLGVIVIGIFTIIRVTIPLIYLLLHGNGVLKTYFLDPIDTHADLKEQYALNLVWTTFEKDPDKLGLFLITCWTITISMSILVIIGAIKLYKWLLVPFIITYFIECIILLSGHIVLMIIMKKRLNLGVLIAATVTGGFYWLLLAYMWVVVVAFFQILETIATDKYRKLYGDDPLKPNEVHSNQYIENVRMYKTPNFDQITPLKHEKVTTKRQPTMPLPLNRQRNIATININEPDLQRAAQEFRNWYSHELAVVRKSNLIRFS